jgi:hypothetical protein
MNWGICSSDDASESGSRSVGLMPGNMTVAQKSKAEAYVALLSQNRRKSIEITAK